MSFFQLCLIVLGVCFLYEVYLIQDAISRYLVRTKIGPSENAYSSHGEE